MRKIMGLCLVAVFAMAGFATASASAAEPEYYECHKGVTGSGPFSDKHCSVVAAPGKGKYTLQPGIGTKGKAFKGKGGAATLHTPAVKGEVTCKSFKDTGFVNTPKTQNKVISTFTSCVSLGKKCTSPAAKSGSIVTKNLSGEIGYISKSPLKVGAELHAETGTTLAEFSCEGLEIVTSGAVIGEQTGDINTFSKSSTATFAITGGELQAVKNFEGGPNKELVSLINGSGPFPSGQQATAVNKGEELEVKA
jgi:hypothetical protein